MIVVLLSLVLASCGESGSATSSSTTSTTTTTVATTTSSTTTTTEATTTTTIPQVPQSSPAAAAAALLAAWRAGDEAAARTVASPDAVDALFAHPAEPTEGRGCEVPIGDTSDCSFSIRHEVFLTIRTGALDGGWVVEAVLFS